MIMKLFSKVRDQLCSKQSRSEQVQNLLQELEESKTAIQNLTNELAEKELELNSLRDESTRQMAHERLRSDSRLETRMQSFFSEIATPALQLMNQAYLVETGRSDLSAADVLLVSNFLLRVLKENGLQIDGVLGAITPFDPEAQEPIDSQPLTPGITVRVVSAGASYAGKSLQKILVQAEASTIQEEVINQ